MKYIIGIMLGLVLGGIRFVYASGGFYQVKKMWVDQDNFSGNQLIKIYDEDNKVSCYLYNGNGQGQGGISCVK